MHIKHLIIFAIAGIVILLGFNTMNGQVEQTDINAVESNGSDIASKPLGQQPKAVIDKATTQIAQAEQVNQQRTEQMADTQ